MELELEIIMLNEINQVQKACFAHLWNSDLKW
jgi:hypothetical protein